MPDENQPSANDGVDWDNAKIINPVVVDDEADKPVSNIRGDVLLNMIASLAEKGLVQGITLYTQGLVLTGLTVSRKTYFEESLAFSKVGENPMSYLFEDLLNGLDEEGEEDGPSPNYNYVHLRAAQVMMPGQNGMPAEGILMRIARAEVIGWSLGQLRFSGS